MPNAPEPPPPVPPHVVAAGLAAFDLHDPSLPVAALTADSLLDRALPRPQGADRRLVFDLDDLRVDVTLWRDAAAVQMQVQVYRVHDRPDPVASGGSAAGDSLTCSPLEPDVETLELVQPPHRTKVSLRAVEARTIEVPAGLTSLVLHRHVEGSAAGLRTAWFTV